MEPMTDTPPGPPTLRSVLAVLDRAATFEEPNEEIVGLTVLHHGLQCAWHLRRSDPDDLELQVAGLLHDVGHVLRPGADDVHGAVGAEAVRPVLGDRVADLIDGHVPAKRYLVTVDDAYRAELSEGSLRTLAVQGEAMSDAEMAAFAGAAHFDAVVRLRRADEAAKDPAAVVPPLEHWLPTLSLLAG